MYCLDYSQVIRALTHPDAIIGFPKAAATLRQLLVKHEYDSRYQDADTRAKVAAMYLPLVPSLWEHLPVLMRLKAPEAKRDLMACVLYLLSNLPPSDVLQYLTVGPGGAYRMADDAGSARAKEHHARWLSMFTDLLHQAVVLFEYSSVLSLTAAPGSEAGLIDGPDGSPVMGGANSGSGAADVSGGGLVTKGGTLTSKYC